MVFFFLFDDQRCFLPCSLALRGCQVSTLDAIAHPCCHLSYSFARFVSKLMVELWNWCLENPPLLQLVWMVRRREIRKMSHFFPNLTIFDEKGKGPIKTLLICTFLFISHKNVQFKRTISKK